MYAVHVEFDALGAYESALVVEVVEADCHTVRADRWVFLGCRLFDAERGNYAVCVNLDSWAQRVHAGGLEPQLGPRRQLSARGDLELGHQVLELGVAVRVLLEVRGHTLHELLKANPGHELLEDRSALCVGDAVEVDVHVLKIVDGCNNWVGRGELVLTVCPGLFHGVECGPSFLPLRCLGGGEG